MIKFNETLFWNAVADQKQEILEPFFNKEAKIYWHASNEVFDVADYMIANCKYPGEWHGTVSQRMDQDNRVITITKVDNLTDSMSFFVVSFFTFKDGLIIELNEYWSDIGSAPQWRTLMNIGSKIDDSIV